MKTTIVTTNLEHGCLEITTVEKDGEFMAAYLQKKDKESRGYWRIDFSSREEVQDFISLANAVQTEGLH